MAHRRSDASGRAESEAFRVAPTDDHLWPREQGGLLGCPVRRDSAGAGALVARADSNDRGGVPHSSARGRHGNGAELLVDTAHVAGAADVARCVARPRRVLSHLFCVCVCVCVCVCFFSFFFFFLLLLFFLMLLTLFILLHTLELLCFTGSADLLGYRINVYIVVDGQLLLLRSEDVGEVYSAALGGLQVSNAYAFRVAVRSASGLGPLSQPQFESTAGGADCEAGLVQDAATGACIAATTSDNQGGEGPGPTDAPSSSSDSTSSMTIIIAAAIGGALVLVALVLCCCLRRRRRAQVSLAPSKRDHAQHERHLGTEMHQNPTYRGGSLVGRPEEPAHDYADMDESSFPASAGGAALAAPQQGEARALDFGTCRLGRVVGKGEFGEVYQATWGGATVALKMVQDTTNKTQVAAIRAERDVNLKLANVHGNIVQLVGFCERPVYALALEFCSKGDLRSYLRDTHPVPSMLTRYMEQTCDAMAYVASRKIVHRDLVSGDWRGRGVGGGVERGAGE